MKVGLVLEGGGMRGVYTVGVLDAMLEQQCYTDYVIGVSAGAANGVSYVSRQKGRALKTNLDFLGDKRYLSLSNYIRTKSLFGMDFIFNEIPDKLMPFDYEAFQASPCEFKVGVTNVLTGETEYFGKEAMNGECTVLRASASIPLFSPVVDFRGKKYLDGATSDSIPVKKALADGCDKLIVVLTRERGFVKPPESFKAIYTRAFKKTYPEMINVLNNRHIMYNETLRFIEALEKEGRAIVIAPRASLGISRFEKKKEKLMGCYDLGKEDFNAKKAQIDEWLNN